MSQLILAGLLAGMNRDFLIDDFHMPPSFRNTKSKRKRSRYQVRGW